MDTTDSSPSRPEVAAGDPFILAGSRDHHDPNQERPHGCYSGWVFLGFEGEDEIGEHVEVVERVPCRRCHGETR